jgi:hypothetical protein
MIVLALFTVITALTSSATYTWPNYVMDELEHLLVDNGGFNDGGVKSAVTPCSNYVSGSQLAGRETAAQWIRVAFRAYLFSHQLPYGFFQVRYTYVQTTLLLQT